MKCREYEKQVQNFLMDEMDDDAMLEFMEHVQVCPRCYEELEVYHSVYDGLRFMRGSDIDENDMESSGTRLLQLLEMRRQRLRRNRLRYIIKRIVLVLFVLSVIGIVSSFLFGVSSIWKTDQHKNPVVSEEDSLNEIEKNEE